MKKCLHRPTVALIAVFLCNTVFAPSVPAQFRLGNGVAYPFEGEVLLARLHDAGKVEAMHMLHVNRSPALMVAGRAPQLLDGKVIARFRSPSQRLIALLTLAEAHLDRASYQLQIYRSDGARRASITLPMFQDAPLPVVAPVDSTESFVVANPATARLSFYSKGGTLLAEKQLFKGAAFSQERGLAIAVAQHSGTIAVAAMREPFRPKTPDASGNVVLFIFSPDGTLRWQQALSEPVLHELRISRRGAKIAVACHDPASPTRIAAASYFFHGDGRQQARVPMLFEKAIFSPDENEALLLRKRDVHLIHLNTGEHTKIWQAGKRQRLLIDAAFSGEGTCLAVLTARAAFENNAFTFNRPVLQILARDGVVLQQMAFDGKLAADQPLLTSPDRRYLAIVFQNRIQIFPWNRDND